MPDTLQSGPANQPRSDEESGTYEADLPTDGKDKKGEQMIEALGRDKPGPKLSESLPRKE